MSLVEHRHHAVPHTQFLSSAIKVCFGEQQCGDRGLYKPINFCPTETKGKPRHELSKLDGITQLAGCCADERDV
jgi:hypothetical protein